jgi:hypothetical protein
MTNPLFQKQVQQGCWHAANSHKVLSLDADALTFEPWFVEQPGTARCLNESVIGFHCLVALSRSVFRAINFLLAGAHVSELGLYAPAVGLFYTSSFHALHTFLGLEGRILLNPVWCVEATQKPIPVSQRASAPSKFLMAIVTKDNRWKYEPRKPDHRTKWLELRQVFAPLDYKIPSFVQRLFAKLYGQQFRPGTKPIEVLRNPDAFRIGIREAMDDFLGMIANVRHAALYEGVGVDPHLIEAEMNGDVVARPEQYSSLADTLGIFAASMLTSAARDLAELFSSIPNSQALHDRLALRISIPWPDPPALQMLVNGDLKAALTAIRAWATPSQ